MRRIRGTFQYVHQEEVGAIVKDLGLIDNAPSSHTVGEQFISFLDNDVDAHVSLLDRRHRSLERPGTRPPHLSPRGG